MIGSLSNLKGRVIKFQAIPQTPRERASKGTRGHLIKGGF